MREVEFKGSDKYLVPCPRKERTHSGIFLTTPLRGDMNWETLFNATNNQTIHLLH